MSIKRTPPCLGLPRMRFEAGEKRDFMPAFVREIGALGLAISIESGLGSGMGFTDADYLEQNSSVRAVDRAEAFAQEIVLMLRCPLPAEWTLLRPGSTFISMLHFPTRPERVERMAELGFDAISLDSITDDDGRRLVENLRDVAWNGVEAAFDVLEKSYESFFRPARPAIRVTIMGAGQVGKHAVEAALKYGNLDRNKEQSEKGMPGIEVVVVGRNLSSFMNYMRDRFQVTDILIDATQRQDASRPVVPNEWIAWLPRHAVICDLNVDPYLLEDDPPTVRSIEGIPQGDLDQYIFLPNDPAWSRTVPDQIPSDHRRAVVSCYSWPGIHPEICMKRYGGQLVPFFEVLSSRERNGPLREEGPFFERALWRAGLRRWTAEESGM